MDNDKKTLAYKIGQFVALTLLVCGAICVVGLAVATTIKFYMWLF